MDPLVVMENLPREGMFVRGSFGDYCKARDALAAATHVCRAIADVSTTQRRCRRSRSRIRPRTRRRA